MLTYHRSRLVRFFARNRKLLSQTPGNIDVHHGVGVRHSLVGGVASAEVRRGEPYFVRGWAIDFTRKNVPWDILIEIDGRIFPARTRLRLPRPDLESRFGPELLASGFSSTFDTRTLAVGPHELTVRAIVGRRGAAYASIQDSIRFFVLDAYPPSLPRRADLANAFNEYHVEPVGLVRAGGILELSGWALDHRGAPITGVAAQINDHTWIEGWTGIPRSDGARTQRNALAGFRVRMPLDLVTPGTHTFRLAAKSRDGRWNSLGGRAEVLVTTDTVSDLRWARGLVDCGEASITDNDGRPLTQIVLYRVSTGLSIRGTLRRSTPLGPSASLVARAENENADIVLPAWSAPTNDPRELIFGAEFCADDLPPKTYHLFVDAPDATQRFIGRCDTGCVLVVRPNAQRASMESA